MPDGVRRYAGVHRLTPRRIGRASILLGLMVSACATADPVNFANGQTGYSIRCDLGLNGLAQCYQKAGSLCGAQGYTLRDWKGNQVTFAAVEQNLDTSFSSFSAKAILAQCNPP